MLKVFIVPNYFVSFFLTVGLMLGIFQSSLLLTCQMWIKKGLILDEYSTNETLLKQGLSWTQSNEILALALKFFEYYIDISLQIMKKKKLNSFLYMNILALEGFGEQNCSRERWVWFHHQWKGNLVATNQSLFHQSHLSLVL